MMLHRPTTDSLRARSAAQAAQVAAPAPASKHAPRGRAKRTLRSLLTPAQMNAAILRESARVDRKSGAALVLVLLRFTGRCTAPSAMRLAKTVLDRLRVTDDAGWFDAQHVGVLLPETAPAGAWRFAQQVCDRVAKRGGVRPHLTMYSYGGDPVSEADETPKVTRQTDEMVPEAKAG
jgi:hypothetical protein